MTVETTVTNTVIAGGVGSSTTPVINFEIKQIIVNCSLGTKFRFEATETSTGNFIDKNRKLHDTLWDIEKNFAINDSVEINFTSVNPAADTCTTTFKHLDNFT